MAGEFERLMTSLDYPMFIVTAAGAGERSGCLVGFATQTSIDPPRFLVLISKKNHTYGVALEAAVLGVHVVTGDDRDLAELFGGETGDELDKFATVEWWEGPAGVPLLERSRRWFAGRVIDRLDLGDHCGFLLEPLAAEKGDGGAELGFQEAKRIEPGHEP